LPKKREIKLVSVFDHVTPDIDDRLTSDIKIENLRKNIFSSGNSPLKRKFDQNPYSWG
jgi:hypothetical protein